MNDTISRSEIKNYINIFENHNDKDKIKYELNILYQALNSNVIWDEVIEIEMYDTDQNNYVYDFTVPFNETFMIDNGIIVHNTLNTKHSSGSLTSNSLNQGVARISELLHYSKNIKTPAMIVYFKSPYNTNITALNKIISHFKFLSIKDLLSNIDVYYDLGGNDSLSLKIKNDNVSNPFFINNQKIELSSLPFVFRFSMNIEKMFDKEITLLDIKTKFISHWYKNFTNIKNLKKNEKDIITKINRCAILSNNLLDDEQVIHIRFNMISFNYNSITEFLRIVIEDITLKGIENISNYSEDYQRRYTYNNETGDAIIDKEYVVITSGINLDKIKLFKGIDLKRTRTNDIYSILKTYGIEAARQVLIHELLSGLSGSNVNHSHLSVLVDQMCHSGDIISIDRHGLSKIDIDPIARASFEKTMEHFVNAALFNEKDELKSVSSRIALGKIINGGTGCFDLLLDMKKLENSEYTEDETSGRITFTPLEEDPILTDIILHSSEKADFFDPN
jgi:DNA-directed RNA polymerase II subunit RPB1